MKKGVLELIYNRTRYLFYNPADSISPIVPNNLRDLFNLIALLAAMEEIPDSRELTKKHALETNKNMFKLLSIMVCGVVSTLEDSDFEAEILASVSSI